MQQRKIQWGLYGLTASALSFLSSSNASAEVLYNSFGFESSAGYVANESLTGQPAGGPAANQWQQTGSTSVNPPYPYAGVITYPASTQQLVGVADNNIGASDFGYWFPGTYASPNAPFTPVAGVTNDVLVSWTEAYTASTGNPLFGIQVFDGSSSVALAGIDATTGLLVVENPTGTDELGSNFFQGVAGTYYNFLLALNYTTQQYSIYINGSSMPADTESFATPATQFTDADILTYVLGGGNANGDGYFDNYLVQAQNTVPEPASLSAMAAASLLLVRRPGNDRRKAECTE